LVEIEPTDTREVTSNLSAVRPETIRVCERHGLLNPVGKVIDKRSYTSWDMKRLLFIQELLEKGLSVTYISNYLGLYSCWFRDDCSKCMGVPTRTDCSRPCWKERGTYCHVPLGHQDLCKTCAFGKKVDGHVVPLTHRTGKKR